MSNNSISAYTFCAVENTFFDDHGDIGSEVDDPNKLFKSQHMKKAQAK